MEILYKELSYDVIGAAMEVHNALGCGFLEKVYQEAMAIELDSRNIPFEREKRIQIEYKGHVLSCPYIADFVIDNKLILELKALNKLEPQHEAQVLNYLHATNMKLGLLVNFGEGRLQYKRLININK